MSERFYKYQGLGNDFVILDRRATGQDLAPGEAERLCDRRRGIGGDGVLVVLRDGEGRARMVVHNADGSIAEMCGNGLRCVVRYLVDHGGGRPERLDVATGAGVLGCAVSYRDGEAEEISIAMGPARLLAANLPSGTSGPAFVQAEVPGAGGLKGTAVSMGNPHLVLFGADLALATALGPKLETWERFPDRTNVEFVQPLEGGGFQVVVWERGSGLTQACGTGACATVAAAVHEGRVRGGEWVKVLLPGGPLAIKVAPDLSAVELRGPATFVFEGMVPQALMAQ